MKFLVLSFKYYYYDFNRIYLNNSGDDSYSSILLIKFSKTIESNIAYFNKILGIGLIFQLLYWKDLSNFRFKYS